MRKIFEALTIRNYAILWAGSLFTFTAFFMSTVVQSIIAFELTGRNSAVGAVLLAQGIGSAVFSPFGGAIVDRVSKKIISTLSQLAIAAVFFVTAYLIYQDEIELYHLSIGAFVTGASFAFLGPARQAWVVELLPLALRPNAVALTQISLSAARIWAPALATLLVASLLFGSAGAYCVMGILFTIATITLFFLPASIPESSHKDNSIFGDMIEGIKYVKQHSRLKWMLTLFFIMVILGLSSTTVLPGLLENELNKPVEQLGTLQTVNAVGGLIASLLVTSFAGSKKALFIYTLGALLSGIALVITGLSATFIIVLIPMLLLGLGNGAFQTLNGAVIVLEADPAFYGRVISITQLAFSGFMLAGLPVGLAADHWGERNTLIAIGLTLILAVLVLSPLIARGPRSNIVNN